MSTWHPLRRFVFACCLSLFATFLFSVQPARSQDKIVIGSVMDLTGPVSTLAQYTKRGVDIALAEVNAAGGINGKPVELVSLNSESKPDLAASLALRIAGRDDVNVMIGGNFGSTMQSIGSIEQRQHIPHVTSTGWVDDSQRTWKYSFFNLVDFSEAAKAMLAYAQKKGYKRIGIMRLEREYGELGLKYVHKF